MLPLELAGFWLGAGLVTWDLGLLLLGAVTRLLGYSAAAARQSARGGEDIFSVSALIEGVIPP